MSITRCILAMILMVASSLAGAQDNSGRPIRIIVPFAAGNGLDIMSRAIANGLNNSGKYKVIVENRPGANGLIAAREFLNAPADGYTLFAGDIGSLLVNPILNNATYDARRDMVPIVDVMAAPWVFYVTKSSGIKTMQEFVAAAKAAPGKLSYGSTGLGAPNFLAVELLRSRTNIQLLHVPYRDANQLRVDLIEGGLNLMVASWASALPVMDRLQPLAVATAVRQPSFPEVPTMEEALGITDFQATAWAILVARRETPAAIIQQLRRAATDVVSQEELQKRAGTLGLLLPVRSSEEISKMMDGELRRYEPFINQAKNQK